MPVLMLFCLSLFICPGIFSEQEQAPSVIKAKPQSKVKSQRGRSLSESGNPLINFMIIGAQKSGTTALHWMLRQHPQICMGAKEVHYFDRHYTRGINWYAEALPKRKSPDQLIGEKTPYYLFHPAIPERIFTLAPDVKLIVILRNPADRAYSHYWHNQRMEIEPLSFEEAISAEWMRIEGEKEHLLQDSSYHSESYHQYTYLSRGIYLPQIKQWLAFFPRSQMLILSSSDLKNNQEETLAKVFAFLEIPPYSTKAPERFIRNYPPIEPETRKQLITFFEPFNQELEDFLGMKFNWE